MNIHINPPANTTTPMTRRYPKLKPKQLERDANITKKLVYAWDVCHDKNRAMEIFIKDKHKLSDERYWELLRSMWIMCGSMKTLSIFRELMASTRKKKFYFSTPEEEKKFEKMPDPLTVYRAIGDEEDDGISWTTSKEYAEYYRKQFSRKSIIEKQVFKSQVFAYIERANEHEIILL